MAQKILILLVLTLYSILNPCFSFIELNYPAVFNFGDSNSDTGGLFAGMAFDLKPPNGETYFKKTSGRYADGRLIIDFLMDAMDLPFLNPYLDSIGAPSFRKGCNFAAAGSTISRLGASTIAPFSFNRQVAQFLRFKARALDILAETRNLDNYLPGSDFFAKGLYMFDIGQNDLYNAFLSKSYDEVISAIPTILEEFEASVKKLYGDGARNFWVHNTGPLGCLPQNIALFGKDLAKLDNFGCVKLHNQAARIFNLQLHGLCTKFQSEYADANVIYVDIFTIKSTLIANYTSYGFDQPIMACCGFGGPPLNYDSKLSCGITKKVNGSSVTAKGCNDSSKYVNWDGIHFTEAATYFVSTQILTGKYSDPPSFNMRSFSI